jgi:hypothetical protein
MFLPENQELPGGYPWNLFHCPAGGENCHGQGLAMFFICAFSESLFSLQFVDATQSCGHEGTA